MRNKRFNNQKGLTLVELLAAITILSIIVLPMFQLLGNTFSVYIDDQRNVKAMSIAQNNIEESKNNKTWLEDFDKGSYDYDPTRGYYIISENTDDNYVSEILMKSSIVNGTDTVKILVNVYWEASESDNLLTFLITEVRVPK